MMTAFRPATVLVTGGAGFIGSNLVRWVLANEPRVRVINLDALTYAGDPENLADIAIRHGAAPGDGRYWFVRGDIRDRELVTAILSGSAPDDSSGELIPAPDAVLHLAAESHVDRSIAGPMTFVSTNVEGTATLLEAVRNELAARPRTFRFVNVSTDEVYGSLGAQEAPFTEAHPLRPNSPYSASKAAGDCLVRAYRATYGLPCLTTRGSNTYGPRQYPEKLVPVMISRALADMSLPIYGDGRHIRDWIHVDDHAAGIWAVCTRGDLDAEVYNLGGGTELANIDMARRLLGLLDKPESLITYVEDRPGHDRRCAIDATRARTALGWTPGRPLMDGLAETVAWYRAKLAPRSSARS